MRSLLSPAEAAVNGELARLKSLPEQQPVITEIFGWPFTAQNGKSFAHLYELFFIKRFYTFESTTDAPYIVDCGANAGVSVVWWKKRYPRSRVLAFEADPAIFQMLQANCAHLDNVQLVNAAVWTIDGELEFSAIGGEGGHITALSRNYHCIKRVRGIRLRPFLSEQCDFLKMDIEGAEVEVLRDCEDLLMNVERAFIEYHSLVGRPQYLGETIGLLERAGFRLYVHTELPSVRPLEELGIFNGKDARLNLFCYREATSPRLVPWTAGEQDSV